MKKTIKTLLQAAKKPLVVITFVIGLCLLSPSAEAAPKFDLLPLSGIPLKTSHSATNGNTNFNSSAFEPDGKDIVIWFKVRGTNASTTGSQTWSLFGAPDKTNYQTTALATFTLTYNGTNPVIKPFHLAATNFIGMEHFKLGALTNASTNYGAIDKVWVARPK